MNAKHDEDWDGGWAADAAAKRAAWAATTPAQRMAWLESALELAAAVGALREDRRRRAAAAQAWSAPRRQRHSEPT